MTERLPRRISLEALCPFPFPSADLSRPERFPGDGNGAPSAARGSTWERAEPQPALTPSAGGAIHRCRARPSGLGRNPSAGADRLEGQGSELCPGHRLDHTARRVTPRGLASACENTR